MSRTNAAVAVQPEIRWKVWIWFENREVPRGSSFRCTANWSGEKVSWNVELSWEGEIVNDEVHGEFTWPGSPLVAGNMLTLSENGHDIGRIWIKSEVE